MFNTVIPLLELLLKLSPGHRELEAAIATLKREEFTIASLYSDGPDKCHHCNTTKGA